MVIGGIIKTISDTSGTIIAILTKNKLLATIFLLLILFLAGNVISEIFTSGYSCVWSESAGNETQLADMSLYTDCILPFYKGSIEKNKLNKSECITYASVNNRDQLWNETCQELAVYLTSTQTILDINQRVDDTLNWIFQIMGKWFHEVNGSEIVEIWTEPNYCPDLYNCLKSNEDAIAELGLSSVCTMSNFPTAQQYENATIDFYPDGKAMAGMFFIDCVSTDQSTWKPRLTYFGLDIFDWKLWVLLTILIAVFTAYRKWGHMLKR